MASLLAKRRSRRECELFQRLVGRTCQSMDSIEERADANGELFSFIVFGKLMVDW